MKNKLFSNVIGLMSGTSADGIDVSVVNTNGETLSRTNQNLIYPYSEKVKKEIRFTMSNPIVLKTEKEFINQLEADLTQEHINAVKFIVKTFKIKPSIIGFHGQTVFHDATKKKSIQLGDGKLLSEKTGCKVVYDFRSLDIKNGGEGAPLAPIYHKCILNKLFNDKPNCFLNIGGVSNLSYIDKELILGFDTGPGCGLMDEYIQLQCGKEFDENGKLASFGKPNEEFIHKLMQKPYFIKNPPKSLDKLDFKSIFRENDFLKLNIKDGMATLCEFTAESISLSIKNLIHKPNIILVAGGGRHNKFLLKRIKKKTNINIVTSDQYNINGDYIEAELIAYLAIRHLNNLPSTFSSTTGTKYPTICGKIAE